MIFLSAINFVALLVTPLVGPTGLLNQTTYHERIGSNIPGLNGGSYSDLVYYSYQCSSYQRGNNTYTYDFDFTYFNNEAMMNTDFNVTFSLNIVTDGNDYAIGYVKVENNFEDTNVYLSDIYCFCHTAYGTVSSVGNYYSLLGDLLSDEDYVALYTFNYVDSFYSTHSQTYNSYTHFDDSDFNVFTIFFKVNYFTQDVVTRMTDGSYENGYTDGYRQGQSDGYTIGLTDGITRGYNSGYDTGYDEGVLQGQSTGYENGYSEGYSIGYSQGDEEGYYRGLGSNNDYTFKNLFAVIADVPIMITRNLLGFEVFGISAWNILISMIAGVIGLFIFRRIIL